MNNQTLTLPIIDTHDPELTVLEILSQEDYTVNKAKGDSPSQDQAEPANSNDIEIINATNSNTANITGIKQTHQPNKTPTQPISQRSIAKTLNLSLGMTNAIIKRLVTKGWVTIHRVNPKNLQYSLTPEGTREVARRTYRYLRRTMGQVGRWKEKIDQYMEELKAQGYTKVLLVGETDLDFILEHCAVKAGLEWEQGKVLKEFSHTKTVIITNVDQSSMKQSSGISLEKFLLNTLK